MCSKNASIMCVQLNLSTTATLGTEEIGHCREVAIVESFKLQSMHGLSTIKSGHCGEVAVIGGSNVFP